MKKNNDEFRECPVCGQPLDDGYCDQCGYGTGWMNWYLGK